MSHDQTRTYNRADSVVFLKTNDPFGGLSNMAGGFPLRVNGIRIRTSEALYQACRFPHLPQVQRLIIGQKSPMTAKMKSMPHRQNSRPDWYQVRVKIMRWCLRVKLAQNWGEFSKLLLETGHRPIVEQSRRDDFWGANPVDKHMLIGMNVLGRLLMELREAVKIEKRESFLRVDPLGIRDFQLGGCPIETVAAPNDETVVEVAHPAEHRSCVDTRRPMAIQYALFDSQAAKEAPLPGYTGEKSKSAGLSNIKFYPDMKNSGVEWLGDMPAHWSKLPGRACFSEKKISNTGMKETTVLSLSYGQIVVKPVEKLHGLVPASFETYQVIDPGDIVVRPTDLQNDWNSLRFGLSRHRGIITSAYMCLNSAGVMARDYGYLLLQAYDLKKVFYGLGSGLRQNLDWSDFKYLPCLVPPLPEQAAIVRFLDHMDRRIQRYIRAKQKLLTLLEEQKQAIIHRAVTRGLDPDVRLKPSGVGWIGDIPEHWEVAALRHRYSQCLGKMLDSKRITGSHSLPYLRNIDVQWDRINTEDLPMMDIPPAEHDRYTVQQGDLLVFEGGEVGRCALWSGELAVCGFQKALHRLRPRNLGQDVPRFMYHALRAAAKGNAFNDGHFSTIAHLTGDKLRAHRFPFPPVAVQESLVSFLDAALKQIDQAISNARRQIALLREYRTRLISDVVTGKLDVCEAAAHLSREHEALEESDG